jgi:Cu2+-exporting ATPase
MMFAVSVYAADLTGEVMDAGLLHFFRIVSLLISTPVMFYAGAPIFAGAWSSLRLRTVGMDVPVSIALVLAYAASVWNTLQNQGEVYFDSVTMFVFFLTLGRFVQMSARHRTTDVTDALARQLPPFAHRVQGNAVQDVPVSSLNRGDVVLVRSGEILPVDGELIDPQAHIDEAMLTGESMPVRRRTGEQLTAGTLNVQDPIRIRATQIASGTVMSHVVALLRRAQAQKPAISRAADAAAARFLRYVLLGAGLTCAAWLAIDPSRAFEATLAVLVVACPCAFAIATPAAMSAATAQLARRGLLVTRPDALEALAHIDTVVFDKTGTLTSAEWSLAGCTTSSAVDEHTCLQIAAALEQASEHPLARAFSGIEPLDEAREVRCVAGAGVEGLVRGRRYRIGSPQFVEPLRPATSSREAPDHVAGDRIADDRMTGHADSVGMPAPAEHPAGEFASTTLWLGDEQQVLACFRLHDVVRPDAAESVAALREAGIDSRILSGDSEAAVASVAARCGITEFSARRSPADKLAAVQAMQAEGRRVAMMGDGVNDAPVLAAADVSLAMGRGAALAHAGADMLLMGERIRALPEAMALSRKTLRIARQNLFWAAAYNLGSLPLAALGFIPPWLAALGMSLSSVGVVLNALRLLPSKASRPGSGPGSGLPDAQARPVAASTNSGETAASVP